MQAHIHTAEQCDDMLVVFVEYRTAVTRTHPSTQSERIEFRKCSNMASKKKRESVQVREERSLPSKESATTALKIVRKRQAKVECNNQQSDVEERLNSDEQGG